jgi:acyl-coenzyme A thioesterase 13
MTQDKWLIGTLGFQDRMPAIDSIRNGDEAMEIPQEFVPIFRTSPFLDTIGPLFCRGEAEQLSIGMRVAEKHCNARGSVHGGVLATLCDIALGYTMAFSTNPPQALTTANLNISYAGTAKLGDWIESRVDIQRRGSRLSFGNC